MTFATAISFKNLYVVFQVFLISSFAIGISLKKWDDKHLNNFTIVSSIFILFILVWWLALSRNINGFRAYLANPNVLAAFLWNFQFFLFTKLISSSKKKYIYTILIFISNLMIFFTGARSLLISSIFSTLIYIFWGWWVTNKRKHNFVFSLFIAVIGFFIYFYAKIIPALNIAYYTQISRDYTGKNLLSGRQVVWSLLIDKISEQPLFGYGSGTNPSDLIGTTLSSHNLYLQILIQIGFLGLITFIVLMFKIWNIYRIAYQDNIVRLSASFMIGILIHQSFEVTLIQNNLAVGLLQFMVISIGISRTKKPKFYNIASQN
ncbi:MAG: O-antigen ligase family protein [Rivularia sp. (in: Bacteria)]|nr:O-antigen ligase family protein [Rivularia sp. MS3]